MQKAPVNPELDLSWLDQLVADQPVEEPTAEPEPVMPEPEQEQAAPEAVSPSEAPTMLIPEVPEQVQIPASEAPTMQIPVISEPKPAAVPQPEPKKPSKAEKKARNNCPNQ